MGAPTEVYVDPSIAADSGAGTIGDPYGDLQYALNTKTRDSTNGDRFNIKAGTAEAPSAALTLATYGSPTAAAPLILQGYTAAAGDGGQAEINGGGATMWASTSYSYVRLVDLKCHNFGTGNYGIRSSSGSGWRVYRCELYDAGTMLYLGVESTIVGNYIYNVATNAILTPSNGTNTIYANYIEYTSGGNLMDNAIRNGATSSMFAVINNYIALGGTCNGIDFNGGYGFVEGNTIFCAGGTGTGIIVGTAPSSFIVNNYIEGFSGAGGVGMSATVVGAHGYNAYYNNTTHKSITTALLDFGNDLTPSASGLVNAASKDFRRLPALKRLGYPQATIGGLSFTDYGKIGAGGRLESMRRMRAMMMG